MIVRNFRHTLYFSSILLELLCDLIQSSSHIQQEVMQTKGFLVISYLLEKVSYCQNYLSSMLRIIYFITITYTDYLITSLCKPSKLTCHFEKSHHQILIHIYAQSCRESIYMLSYRAFILLKCLYIRVNVQYVRYLITCCKSY